MLLIFLILHSGTFVIVCLLLASIFVITWFVLVQTVVQLVIFARLIRLGASLERIVYLLRSK